LRPPLAADRVRRTDNGDVILELRHRWADGTTHLRFDPIELFERLAALTPRPRINLLLYYGVLGAHAAWRPRVCPGESAPRDVLAVNATPSAPTEAHAAGPSRTNILWAELMQRSFPPSLGMCSMPSFGETSPERIARRRVGSTRWCAMRGARLRLLAIIEAAGVIRRILGHLRLPTEVPAPRPSRAPPLAFDEPA
jgi:hypothetical protein